MSSFASIHKVIAIELVMKPRVSFRSKKHKHVIPKSPIKDNK
jgi:hypothetical protein